MAVKGERDPAACAHIHPTSSRKPAVAGATLVMGGATVRVPSEQKQYFINHPFIFLASFYFHKYNQLSENQSPLTPKVTKTQHL